MINPGPILKTALKIIELMTAGDPKERARALRARAENLRVESERLKSGIRTHELNSCALRARTRHAHHGRQGFDQRKRFHEKQIRKLTRKRQRLNGRAVWWDNRADRIDPP